MESDPPYRELLLADMALVLGIAPALDVAFALQRYWEKRADGDSFLAELREVAGLADTDAARLETEVARLVSDAGGDPRRALGARGGLDHSIHVELSALDAPLLRDIAPAGIRTPLRPIASGRYLDFSELGRGGMGIVYLALDTEMNRRVAMKAVLPPRAGLDSSTPLTLAPPGEGTPASQAFRSLAARFLQEAWVTGGLEHPGIVPVYELGRTEAGIPYYTMRLVRGDRTLEKAVAEARTIEDRLALLEPLLKLCDAVAYAHAHGVVHRDLKPANVALGKFGEVVLLDWGLAKVRDRPDLAGDRWPDRIRELRETEDLKTVAGALGTPGYMSPEAMLGDPSEVDERSDVYSLGAILYRILAGRLPFEFRNFLELLGKVLSGPAAPPHEVDPAVPDGLSRIALAALARDARDRTASVADFAGAIRAWQRESAVDREVRSLLDDAGSAWAGIEGLAGDALLGQIDRVLGRAGRALEMRPGNTEAESLVAWATGARGRAISARERTARRALLRRVAVGGLVLALAASGIFAWLLDNRRRKAEAAEWRATEERIAKEGALADVLRLADVKKVRDLEAEADQLWPVHPERAAAMADWAKRARAVLAGRAAHEATLASLRARALPYTEEERLADHAGTLARIEQVRAEIEAVERDLASSAGAKRRALAERAAFLAKEIADLEARGRERVSWRFDDAADAWQQEVLAELAAGLARLADGPEAIIGAVEARGALAAELRAASIVEREAAWRETIAEIADERASPAYHGLRMEPVLGLVPLGKDPGSGLYEFAHAGSGTTPRRDPDTGVLVTDGGSAIVLVLLPGATFRMGAQRTNPARANFDPQAEAAESPVREVSIRPYFIGKHECTQGQWAALTGGGRPSLCRPGEEWGNRTVTDRNPVEQVSWLEAETWLRRHRLRLPSEAEWEYACRAGTDTPWWTGREVATLNGAANVADRWCRTHGGPPDWDYADEIDDGHAVTAPVGGYRANAFGLDDMHGNVFEWCADRYGPYPDAPADGSAREREGDAPDRVYRGGGYSFGARVGRSSTRSARGPGDRDAYLGVRPAASLP